MPMRLVDAVPVPSDAKDSRNASISGLNSAASRLLCTLHADLADDYATLASVWRPTFHRSRSLTGQGCYRYGFSSHFPLSLSFRWRNPGSATDYAAAPPQIRTSGTTASGSSSYGFTASAEWTILGPGRGKASSRAEKCGHVIPVFPRVRRVSQYRHSH